MTDVEVDGNAKEGSQLPLPAAAIAYPKIKPEPIWASHNHTHTAITTEKKLDLTITSALHTLMRDMTLLQTTVNREAEENRRSRTETEKALKEYTQEQKRSEHAVKSLGQMVTSALGTLTAHLQTTLTAVTEEGDKTHPRQTETEKMLRSIIIQTQEQKRGEAQVYPMIDEMRNLLVQQGEGITSRSRGCAAASCRDSQYADDARLIWLQDFRPKIEAESSIN